MIGGGIFWFSPVKLAWNGVPISYTYKFHIEDTTGKIEKFTPDYFSPYDYQFTLGNFKFLNPAPLLPVVWGASNSGTSKFFNEDRSINEIIEYEISNGTVYFNDEKKEYFTKFIKQYLINYNKKSKSFLWTTVKSPRLLWTFPVRKSKKDKQTFRSVVIYEELNYFSKKRGYIKVRTKEICSFPITTK